MVFILVASFYLSATPEIYALAPWLASKNPVVKTKIRTFLDNYRIRYAESPEARRYLASRDADAALIPDANANVLQFLVLKEVAANPIKLIRAMIHEEVEAYMQVLRATDRYVYMSIRELILNDERIYKSYCDLCHSGEEPVSMSGDEVLNDMVAKALEIMFIKEYGFIIQEPGSPEEEKEERFYRETSRVIKNGENRIRFFRDGLFITEKDFVMRSKKIKDALRAGMKFYEAAQLAAAAP
ncbi:MAG: hypothetical protein JW994_00505, partial [Candidatus Omnitrophica bacterium]|nr:hypothetical protein [Candidatus Omnitrophota bacterium]